MVDPGLNPAQKQAVRTLSGPLLVLAGAGTGKTRVITYRIARLIDSGIKPSRILAVTFTNKAAREMKERAQKLLKKSKGKKDAPEISTFHSLCVRVLRRHATLLGYPKEFCIYDRGDQETVARGALRDIRVGDKTLRPGDLLHYISGWKGAGVPAEKALDFAADDKAQLAALGYRRYQESLKQSGAMDFDDLLSKTEELFVSHPEARFAEASRFDHLLIDEYQDTNALQYRIVKSLAERHRNLCVVGDDDQSIYGWRGAEVTHILEFQHDWPEATVVRLEDNYRSRAPILELANTLIKHNRSRHDKVLRPSREGGDAPRYLRFEDETSEAEVLIREIKTRIDPERPERITASDIAILFRTNEQPRAFELELRRERIPYVLVGGLSFYDRKEVRDVLAYLRVLANPNDEVSLLRVLNTPPRGIGAATVETLLERAVSSGRPLWAVLPEAGACALPDNAAQRVEGFRKLIESFRVMLGSRPLADIARELVVTVDYKQEIERLYKNPGDVEARWASVEELVNSVALYDQRNQSPSLLGFLEETALAGREGERDSEKNERQLHAVTLMTLHSAKGLEFPHVYMVGMEEGLLPHSRSIADASRNVDEERRLCYVGVTRARESLTLTLCKTRMKWGKARAQIPSRFLMEMRGETAKAQRMAEAAEKLFAVTEEPAEDEETEVASGRGRKPKARASRRARGE